MKLNYDKTTGLIPAIIQDARTNKVLMLGYMNQDALNKTETTRLITFYSRSKQRLWTKGETSGNQLKLVELKADCDSDALLIQAIPSGPICHKGTDTCWAEENISHELEFISELENIILDRHENPIPESYTSRLFRKGINKIAQKVGEEAVELIIEAKDEEEHLFLGESADLMYHFMVLLRAKGMNFRQVIEVLKKRHKI